MSEGARVAQVLATALAPVPVYRLDAPQERDDVPPSLPLVIVTDAGFEALALTTCGDAGPWTVRIQIDGFAYGGEGVETLGGDIYDAMSADGASLVDMEIYFEPDPRAYRHRSIWELTATELF